MSVKNIDVIILSNTANKHYYHLLAECISSIKQSVNVQTSIILVETNKQLKNRLQDYELPIDTFIVPDDSVFNYNKFLNYGLEASTKENVCFSNNDVVYEKNALDILVERLNVYDSVSPWEEKTSPKFFSKKQDYTGYSTGRHVTGWCICTTKRTLSKMGSKFDESFSFWCADDDYSKTLETHGLVHALIGDATVLHYGEQSHNLWSSEERMHQTVGQCKIFDNKWKS